MGADSQLTTLRRTLSQARSRATMLAQERDCRAFDVLVGKPVKKHPRVLDAAVRRSAQEVSELEAEVHTAERCAEARGLSREPRD